MASSGRIVFRLIIIMKVIMMMALYTVDRELWKYRRHLLSNGTDWAHTNNK